MTIFKNILVGIDPVHAGVLDRGSLSRTAQEAVDRAIELAKASGSRLLFFSVLGANEDDMRFLDKNERELFLPTLENCVHNRLLALVNQARASGIEASSKVVSGDESLEIIQQAQQGNHDLVVLGAKDSEEPYSATVGTTALKLLCPCPCPVLVAKPGTNAYPLRVLVATDLSAGSEEALRLGMGMAREMHAHVHILNVIESYLDEFPFSDLPENVLKKYRQHARVAAGKELDRQLKRFDLGNSVRVHFDENAVTPFEGVRRFIQDESIHLLIMGTIGSSDNPDMIGRNAEPMFEEVRCSVLVVKPRDFQLPLAPMESRSDAGWGS
jgi:universal stress protein E